MVQRSLRIITVVALLLSITVLTMGCNTDKKLSVASVLMRAIGATPGGQPATDQRVTFEGTITNKDSRPLVGWGYRVVPAPLIAGRIVASQESTIPAPGTVGVYPNLEPGKSVTIKGYIDFQAGGLTKQALENAEPLVVIVIFDGAGREVVTIGK